MTWEVTPLLPLQDAPGREGIGGPAELGGRQAAGGAQRPEAPGGKCRHLQGGLGTKAVERAERGWAAETWALLPRHGADVCAQRPRAAVPSEPWWWARGG